MSLSLERSPLAARGPRSAPEKALNHVHHLLGQVLDPRFLASLDHHPQQRLGTRVTIDLVSLPKHKSVRMLVDNKKLKEVLSKLDVNPVEFFKVDIGDNIVLGC